MTSNSDGYVTYVCGGGYDSVLPMLTKHGVTEHEAREILTAARIHARTVEGSMRDRSYAMAKFAIDEAKRIGAENARLGHDGNVVERP
jgi:plasmid stability protein